MIKEYNGFFKFGGDCEFVSVGVSLDDIDKKETMAVAGEYGTAISGVNGVSVSGDSGVSISSGNGYVSSGEKGRLEIEYIKGLRTRKVIGYVGEGDIKPNVFYKLNVDEPGVCLVPVDIVEVMKRVCAIMKE